MAITIMEKRSVQSAATCLPQYDWMDNSKQQIPCLVAGYLLGQCNEGSWIVYANTDPTRHYNTPNATTANQCSCSWAVYNTLQACALCQSGDDSSVSTWTAWSTNCSSFLSAPNPWPKGTVIPEETAIPFWATNDPNSWNDAKFDGSDAQTLAQEDKPDVTNATFNASNDSKSSSSTPVGAIAGGVVGGVLFLTLLGLLAFYLSCRRRSASQRRARGVSVLSLTNTHGRTPSDGTAATTLFNYGHAGGKYYQNANGVNVPGLGYTDRDREFTSPLMSGTPESQGVTFNSLSPGLSVGARPGFQQTPSYSSGGPGSTSTSMLMAPGTTPSPAPGVVGGPPGLVNMAVSPISGGQGLTMGLVNAGSTTLGGSSASGVVPQSPPNPSVNSVSFASRTTHGHGHTVSNTSNISSVELPEGAISPFVLPPEDGTPGIDLSLPNDPFNASANITNQNPNANPNNSFSYLATSTPLRKPHERARINPPAYSPTASLEENMFASNAAAVQAQVRSTSLSFTAASNEATGGDSSVAMSGTTLVRGGAGGGTFGTVGSGSGAGAAGGPETLVGSGTQAGTVRSPSPIEEERERDEHGYLVDRKN